MNGSAVLLERGLYKFVEAVRGLPQFLGIVQAPHDCVSGYEKIILKKV